MRQVFRIGVLVSALLIAAAGCSSIDWFRDMFSQRDAESDQPKGEQVSDRSDQAVSRPMSDSSARRRVQIVHVQFGFNRTDLDNGSQTFLLVLIKKLRENPKLTVDLAGYADSVGSRDYNLQLSQKRVEAVRRYLVARGVDPSRIRSVSVGQLSDAGTPGERAKNRRVTVKLMVSE